MPSPAPTRRSTAPTSRWSRATSCSRPTGRPTATATTARPARTGSISSTRRCAAKNILGGGGGTGGTRVDGERFAWRGGEVIAAPAGRPHFHEASDDAILFRITDEPVMQRLGFYRVEESA